MSLRGAAAGAGVSTERGTGAIGEKQEPDQKQENDYDQERKQVQRQAQNWLTC